MKDFLIVIPCYTERKRKISSFLFLFKTKLLKDIFKTNNKICFAAVFLMISYIALYWEKKKSLAGFCKHLRFFTAVLLFLDCG